jgi:ribosomal protein S18 acetylase RimI-like enzyme
MNCTVRRAIAADEPFLWQMLYYAAHMDEDGVLAESARTNPDLLGYVENWGEREGDLGLIAEMDLRQSAGAAWIRIMPADSPLYRIVARGIPELAIAVAPECIGSGIGTRLLTALLDAARKQHRSIALSVRASNPAKRLYERLGFKTVKSIINRVGTESFVMLCDLD